jgi:hypothetical protein
MRFLAAALGVALGVCILVLAPPSPEHAAALASYRIGDAVDLPTLNDLDGRTVNLAPPVFGTDRTALVLAFWSARCPISRGYEERFAELAHTYATRGVEAVTVTACPDETAPEIRARRSEQAETTRLLIDPNGRLAGQLGVTKTPHFAILGPGGELLYSGAFDSNLIATSANHQPYLREALDSVLAGEPVESPVTRTFGTPVRRQAHVASNL